MRLGLLAVLCVGCVRAATLGPTVPPLAACRGGLSTTELTFPAADGLVVHATLSNPCGGAPRPTVVLAHQMCADRREWSTKGHDWVAALNARGLSTLAIDLRGHGESKTWPDGSTHDLCEELGHADVAPLYAGMALDVAAAVKASSQPVGIVGSSFGANSAIVAAAEPAVRAVVALSPGLDYRGIVTEPSVQALKKPLFLVAADDDERSAAAVRRLAGLDRNAKSESSDGRARQPHD